MPAFDPLAYAFSPAHAARYSGLSLTRIKTLLREGVLACRHDGRHRLILRSDLEAYLLGLGTGAVVKPRGEAGRFAPSL
jgi:excisionase family DNA binding protein